MSELNVLNAQLGVNQGRLQPSEVAPPDGDWAFVLGSDQAGIYGEFDDGDHATVSQAVDLTDVDLLRAAIVFVTPSEVVSGWEWRCALLLDGVEYISVPGWPGQTREITDLAIPVADLSGDYDFGIQLKAVEV